MKMGRERGVLRWDIHASLLRMQIEQAESELVRLSMNTGTAGADPTRQRQRVEHLTTNLAELRHQLRALGPSPRAKMG